jgi:hypothetical protein
MAHKRTLFISTVIVLAWASAASAQPQWAVAGFTGSVDESDASLHVFGSNGAVAVKSSVARGTLNIRYPVEMKFFQFNPPDSDCTELRANLRDTGAGARVIVRLMRLGIGGEAPIGELTLLAEIDSDRLPSSASNEYLTHRACFNQDPGFLTDWTYFVDAQLIKTAATASPGLMSIQICSSQDSCDP